MRNNFDESDTLPALDNHIKELVPRLEMVSYLSSKCLRPRHWCWLSEHVLKQIELTLKFSGPDAEQITVFDTSGRDYVGLGFINRLGVADIIYRRLDTHLDKIRG